jgi:hypothetical protein
MNQLAGYMEAIDADTTTVIDHAHMNYSSGHSAFFQPPAINK